MPREAPAQLAVDKYFTPSDGVCLRGRLRTELPIPIDKDVGESQQPSTQPAKHRNAEETLIALLVLLCIYIKRRQLQYPLSNISFVF